MKKNSFFKEYMLSLREKRKRAVEIRKQCRIIEQMTIELSQNLKYAEAKENKKIESVRDIRWFQFFQMKKLWKGLFPLILSKLSDDKASVAESFKKLIADGVYREELYSDL